MTFPAVTPSSALPVSRIGPAVTLGGMCTRSCGDGRQGRRADDGGCGPADAHGRRTKEILPGDGDALPPPSGPLAGLMAVTVGTF